MNGPASSANENNSVIWPELWSAFAPHRDRVCELLSGLASGADSRLCVWGTGRTTDLDLIELTKQYAQIDLVDLDPNMTRLALLQRGFDESYPVNSIGGLDVTGLGPYWEQLAASPTEAEVRAVIEACSKTKLRLERYDVVASTCLLSQVMDDAYDRMKSSGVAADIFETYLPKIFQALREQHLELMLRHTKPGGSAVLVTDITSLKGLPEMLEPDADLEDIISQHVIHGNHFHGLNPVLINESIQSPSIAALHHRSQRCSPWIWDAGESQYLCLAFRLERK